ncbi:MAG: hypothetical protein MI861_14505 [Pirellulales bacterium]|nr:hypothetical protein [Pirellulales bacterium]
MSKLHLSAGQSCVNLNQSPTADTKKTLLSKNASGPSTSIAQHTKKHKTAPKSYNIKPLTKKERKQQAKINGKTLPTFWPSKDTKDKFLRHFQEKLSESFDNMLGCEYGSGKFNQCVDNVHFFLNEMKKSGYKVPLRVSDDFTRTLAIKCLNAFPTAKMAKKYLFELIDSLYDEKNQSLTNFFVNIECSFKEDVAATQLRFESDIAKLKPEHDVQKWLFDLCDSDYGNVNCNTLRKWLDKLGRADDLFNLCCKSFNLGRQANGKPDPTLLEIVRHIWPDKTQHHWLKQDQHLKEDLQQISSADDAEKWLQSLETKVYSNGCQQPLKAFPFAAENLLKYCLEARRTGKLDKERISAVKQLFPEFDTKLQEHCLKHDVRPLLENGTNKDAVKQWLTNFPQSVYGNASREELCQWMREAAMEADRLGEMYKSPEVPWLSDCVDQYKKGELPIKLGGQELSNKERENLLMLMDVMHDDVDYVLKRKSESEEAIWGFLRNGTDEATAAKLVENCDCKLLQRFILHRPLYFGGVVGTRFTHLALKKLEKNGLIEQGISKDVETIKKMYVRQEKDTCRYAAALAVGKLFGKAKDDENEQDLAAESETLFGQAKKLSDNEKYYNIKYEYLFPSYWIEKKYGVTGKNEVVDWKDRKKALKEIECALDNRQAVIVALHLGVFTHSRSHKKGDKYEKYKQLDNEPSACNHVVTLMRTVRDNNNKVIGFLVNDSGAQWHRECRFATRSDLMNAMFTGGPGKKTIVYTTDQQQNRVG